MQSLSDTPQHCLIYHARDLQMKHVPCAEHWLTDRLHHYQLVAEVAARVEYVRALTTHTRCSWMSRQEIIWFLRDEPLRSTAIGDVIFVCETGAAWLVQHRALHHIPAGWYGGRNMDILNALLLARRMHQGTIYYQDQTGNKAVVELTKDEGNVNAVLVNGRYGSNLSILHHRCLDLDHYWSLRCPI
jgi:hypothetical protein